MFTPAPFHAARPGLLLPGPLHADGIVGPTRSQAQSKHVRRTSRGFYLPATVDNDRPEQRIVEVSPVVPARGAITGWAALRWHGSPWFTGERADGTRMPVDVVVSTHDIRPQAGIRPSGEGFDPRLLEWVDDLPVTAAAYAVSFEMRYADDLRRAVVALDMAAYSDLVSVEEVDTFLTPRQNGWTGVPQARAAVLLASENAWSPQEGLMRLTWHIDAGMAMPLCNAPVFDLRGNHIATPDVIDPVTGVSGDYDGDAHLTRGQRLRDVRRDGALRRHGLETVVMLAPDVRNPRDYLRRLAEARQRMAAVPVADRTWTLTPPPWWVLTDSVARRRALGPAQRRRLLAYRQEVRLWAPARPDLVG